MGLVQPVVLAHRGASGHQPENTLAAFREARRLGADGVELDVHATADGVLAVHHDAEIPGLGAIPSLVWSAIRAAQPAIPSLGEALGVLEAMDVWIELKSLPEAADETLLAAIDQAPSPARCAVHSFDHRIIRRLGVRRPALRRGILSSSYPIDPLEPLDRAEANALWQEWHLIDARLAELVHRRGAQIIAWTVNETPIARQLAAWGVDGLCGNYPERLRFG